MASHLLKPRWRNGDRADMRIDDADLAQIEGWQRQLGREAAITDLLTGKRYMVRSAPCSNDGCNCDAVVVREMGTN